MPARKTTKPRKARATKTQQKQQISAAEARPKIIEMRKRGHSLREIAQKLSMSLGWVHKQQQIALHELSELTRDETEEYRSLQLARYEAMLVSLAPLIQDGDTRAVDSARRILDSINGLMGTNAPTKIAATNKDGEDAEHTHGIMIVPAVAGSVDEWLQQYQKKTPSE